MAATPLTTHLLPDPFTGFHGCSTTGVRPARTPSASIATDRCPEWAIGDTVHDVSDCVTARVTNHLDGSRVVVPPPSRGNTRSRRRPTFGVPPTYDADVVEQRGTPHREGTRVVTLLRRGATRVGRWARSAVDRWDQTEAVRTATRSVELLRRVDRATRYRSPALVGVHLTAIDELFERGAFDEALAAAEDVIEDCRELRRVGSEAAARAHGERARCLARLDRLDESIDEFASSLGGHVPAASRNEAWRLSLRYSLALTRRDVGELEASTEELRELVPAMAEVFGEHSTWLLSTVTELATNVALDGDVPMAIEMVSAQLPGASYHRGPLSREALTLRSKIARWTLVEGGRRRARTPTRRFRARRLHPGRPREQRRGLRAAVPVRRRPRRVR